MKKLFLSTAILITSLGFALPVFAEAPYLDCSPHFKITNPYQDDFINNDIVYRLENAPVRVFRIYLSAVPTTCPEYSENNVAGGFYQGIVGASANLLGAPIAAAGYSGMSVYSTSTNYTSPAAGTKYFLAQYPYTNRNSYDTYFKSGYNDGNVNLGKTKTLAWTLGSAVWSPINGNGTYLSIPTASSTDLFASAGTIFGDTWQLIIIALGVPLAFYVIPKIILLF